MQINIVNAFTADGKNGNPAGVVLDTDQLSEAQMLRTAAELGFSETAFVSKSAVATCRLRFFTPTNEVNLCGHATIAAWSLMYKKGLLAAGSYTQETRAGLLGISIADNGLVFMEQSKAEFSEEIPTALVAPLLGIAQDDFSALLKPQIVSTGIRDLLVPLATKATILSIQPDLTAITRFSRQHGISGLHVFTLLSDEGSIASARNFAPADGIDEEAATGTSNGALLCYLRQNGLLAGQKLYRIEQGESMGSLSFIYGKFVKDTVWIGGETTYRH
jgi:PhzF family phenazine biosynthesis protein